MDQKRSTSGFGPQKITLPVGTPKYLVVLSQVAPTAGKIYKLHKDRIVIGSVVSADVHIQGEGVAPIHAVIEVLPPENHVPRAIIYDLASTTGVFINGSKHITANLKTGDEITVGRYKLKFAVEDPGRLEVNERVRETPDGRKLIIPDSDDLRPLLLEEGRDVEEIFDYRPASKTALEAVMSWSNTILDIQHHVKSHEILIGADRDNDFAIPPVLSGGSHPIATKDGDGYVLNIDPTMTGIIQTRGQLLTLDQIRAQTGKSTIALTRSEFAKVTVGEIDFYFSYTAAPPRLKAQRILDRDPFMMRILSASLASTAAIVLVMMNMEVSNHMEVEQLPERLVTILYEPQRFKPVIEVPRTRAVEQPEKAAPKKPEPQKTVKVDVDPSQAKKEVPKTMNVAQEQPKPQGPKQRKQDEAKEGAGARAKGAEGTRGSKTAAPGKEHQLAAKRPSPQGGKGAGGGNSQVQDQGNVDLLKGAASQITNILGNTAAKLGKGGTQLQGFGNFSTQGSGGQALAGSGLGGGGHAEGLGGLTDRGRGGGRVGTGLGAAGSGSGIIGGRSRVVLRTGGGDETVVLGSIDKAAIAAAIEAHRDEFRLCYEREINAETPNIGGTVKTSFVIGSSGRVTQAGVENSTIRNANVERCVTTVLKRIDFPTPLGGGVVQVTYPFKFASSGKK